LGAVRNAQAADAAGKTGATKVAASKKPVGKSSTDKTAAAAGAKGSAPSTGTARKTTASQSKSAQRKTAKRPTSKNRPATTSVVRAAPAPRPSIGQVIGLHDVDDPLSLHSSVALALDAQTGEVLFEKNSLAVLPIASITKLMTAMVVLEAGLPLDEDLSISRADIDTEKFTRSRLRPGTQLTRDEMLNLALMSSENRAANALGRHYPGGLEAFVARMNAKARELGMTSTHFVEPTGLSSYNVSSAHDLAKMVRAASEYPLIRAHSTASSLTVAAGTRPVSFRNTNRLVQNPDWEIGLQKTGYISEAGNCLVMQTEFEGRAVVLVLLDATGRLSRFGDARRLRDWLEESPRPDGAPHALAQVSRGS
jgi:D-alanyl-D-alanine endopeptidase (penicillin-binding protein 7)